MIYWHLFPICKPLIPFSCIVVLAGVSSTVLNKNENQVTFIPQMHGWFNI